MKKFTCLALFFVLLYFCSCQGVRYIDDTRIAVIVTNCKKLSNLDNQVEYLEIADISCNEINPSIFKNPHLNTLTINSTSIKFPSITLHTSLEKISIINPILNEVPQLVYHSPELRQLILFLKKDSYNDLKMKHLKKLEKLELGISQPTNFPNFIYSLKNLKELRLLSKNSTIFNFSPSLGQLEKLEALDAPIDLSEHITSILKLKKLKSLKATKFSNLTKEAIMLKQLSALEEICLPVLSDVEREILYEVLPNVKVICRDNLILPFNW